MKVFTKLFLTFVMLCFASVMNATDATIIDWVAGEQGYSNSQDLDGVEITLDTKTTMTCAKGTGSNGPKYYTSGSAVRTYGGNVITFKGEGITKIVITGVSGKVTTLTPNVGAITTEGIVSTWKGEANEIVLTNETTSQQHIAKLHVVYGGEEPDIEPVHIANTIENPYTVAKAVELIDAGEALDETVFVKGIISKIDSVNAEVGFITYWISDNGSTEGQQFECYKGKTMEGLALTDIEVGAEVIATGKLTKYNAIYEFSAGNTIAAYKAPFKAPIADGKYYIFNVAANGFIVGANDWGTRASISKTGGIEFEAVLSDGKYELKSAPLYAGKHLGFNGYVDNGDAANWTIVPVEGQEGVFTLTTDGTNVLFWDGGEKTTTTVGAMPETAANAYWKFISAEERLASFANATPENPVDATFLISDPNFSRGTSKAAWKMEANNKNLEGGKNENKCAESYHSVFTLSQIIENAPAGKYELLAQGFYRQDDNETEELPVIYANDKTSNFPAKTGSENSMDNASDSFLAGLYEITPVQFTLFDDGQIVLGAKGTATHQWVIFDNFRLTYLSSEIPASEFKPAYEAALAAAQAALADEAYAIVTGEEKTALAKAIEDYTTVEETVEAYKAAIAALNAATTAFTSAKADYATLANAKESVKAIDFSAYPYASEAKIAAAVAALNATATSAADAKTMAQTVLSNARKAVESNALLEGTYGAVNYSDSVADLNADKNIWTSGSIGTNQGQGYTDGDGEVCGKYLDGGWSSSAGANINLTKEIKLPAGRYILTTTARGSASLTEYSMSIAGQTVTLPHNGADASTGVFGNGWDDAFIVFETTGDPLTLELKAISEATQQWVSINRFRLAQFGVAGEDAPAPVAPEGWTNLIENGNLAGESVVSFYSKEANGATTNSTIVAMAGKDNSRGIVVKSADNPSEAWDTQFWIKLNEALPMGSKLHVEFDYVANKAAKGTTQAHGNPGDYQHWAGIGDVNFTTEWQHFSTDIEVSADMATGNNGKGLLSIAFNLAEEKTATVYRFDNFGVWAQIPEPVKEWKNLIVNSDMEGESMECFYVSEQGVGGPYVAVATEGIGKDGSKAVKVQSADSPTNNWDTQFFIRLPYQLPAGTQYKVSFDYKADKAGDFDTQAHANPGQYIHWAAVGSGSFSTEWQTYTAEGAIPSECDGTQAEGGFLKIFQSIAFNLALNKAATQFIFDNVKFEVPEDVAATLTPNPDQNPVPYPTGIQTVKSEKNAEGIFNLNGQKVMKTQKGLYIMNGKKVVVK